MNIRLLLFEYVFRLSSWRLMFILIHLLLFSEFTSSFRSTFYWNVREIIHWGANIWNLVNLLFYSLNLTIFFLFWCHLNSGHTSVWPFHHFCFRLWIIQKQANVTGCKFFAISALVRKSIDFNVPHFDTLKYFFFPFIEISMTQMLMVHVHGLKNPMDLLSLWKCAWLISVRVAHIEKYTLYHSNALLKKHEIFMQ